MSILNEVFNISTMGESQRIDHAIREHEKLEARLQALVALLIARGVVTREELEKSGVLSDRPSS